MHLRSHETCGALSNIDLNPNKSNDVGETCYSAHKKKKTYVSPHLRCSPGDVKLNHHPGLQVRMDKLKAFTSYQVLTLWKFNIAIENGSIWWIYL